MNATFRHLTHDDLDDLLGLYRYLHPKDAVLPEDGTVPDIWYRLVNDPHQLYWGAFVDGRLVAACNAAVIPNLTRGARPYALIENVITHPDYRRRGIGRALIGEAVRDCDRFNCYKIMLMSNSLRTEAHAFYRSIGFDQTVKTAFVLNRP